MMAILGIIGILVIAFIILGLIGWGVQALGFIVSFRLTSKTLCLTEYH